MTNFALTFSVVFIRSYSDGGCCPSHFGRLKHTHTPVLLAHIEFDR